MEGCGRQRGSAEGSGDDELPYAGGEERAVGRPTMQEKVGDDIG